MDKQHIIEFIDQWLTDNAWRADSRIQDFALDVRLMLEELETEAQSDRLVASAA